MKHTCPCCKREKSPASAEFLGSVEGFDYFNCVCGSTFIEGKAIFPNAPLSAFAHSEDEDLRHKRLTALPLGSGLGPEKRRRLAYLRGAEHRRPCGARDHRPYQADKAGLGAEAGYRHEPMRQYLEPAPRGSSQTLSADQLYTAPETLRQTSALASHRSLSPVTMYSFLHSAWSYFKTTTKAVAIGVATILVLYCGGAIMLGNGHKLPRAFMLMSQATYQGFHCGWNKPAPYDWTACY
jgi:hypothetical protein